MRPDEQSIRPGPGWASDRLGREPDVGSYLASLQRPSQALKVVASQLAGVLLARAAGLKATAATAPALASAEETYAEAQDLFRGIVVPRWAAHRHAHLARAFEGIGAALALSSPASRTTSDATEASLTRLRVGWAEFQKACVLGIGLTAVDLGRCCMSAVGAKPRFVCDQGGTS